MELTPLVISNDLRGKRILLRASLNVPVEGGVVTNPFRLIRALTTIEALASHGARVVVIGHIGRAVTDSLRPVFEEATKKTSLSLFFSDDIVGTRAKKAVRELKEGDVLFIENVRRDVREVKNDNEFARSLSALGEMFVNDAFADSHRAHASIVGIPRHLPSVAGPLFLEEYRGIEQALAPKSPSLAIVGGAKFVTKEPLLKTLLQKYDHVFVGGALANDFFKAQGFEVGGSLVSPESSAERLLKNSKVLIPSDVVVKTPSGKKVKKLGEVQSEDRIYDIGPTSLKMLSEYTKKARTILWNGPMGNFEASFFEGTETVARLVAASNAKSVVGGGDTIAAIEHLKLGEKFTFVSTAGGAMLQFIANGTLPGIEALKENASQESV